jgi:HEAT repeat protein
MGLFDLFKGKGGDKKSDGDRKGKTNPADKWAQAAGDKRAQNYDRQEAIQALADMKSPEAAAALLKRFTFHIDPSITDQEEKEVAFRGVLAAGEDAIEPVRTFAAKADSLAWPMKVLKELLDEEKYIEELVLWLERWDTEYSKFIDPKIQLLVALGDHKHAKIREAVEPFLTDVNETARFHAVVTTLAQDDAAALEPLLTTLADEESFRIKNKICDGISLRGWVVPDEERDRVRKSLPPDYVIDGAGKITSRA